MFTGLIEEQGKIINIKHASSGMEITVECHKILEGIQEGASISINGACQSVTSYGADFIRVQASNETLKVTTFKELKRGDCVNLERAMTLEKRLDGHIVTGHVDCKGEFLRAENDGFSKGSSQNCLLMISPTLCRFSKKITRY